MANIFGILIGLVLGGLLGGVLVMLGTRLVMGAWAQFGSAFVSAIAAAVAGFCIGLVLGMVVNAAAPGLTNMVQILSIVLGLAITPAIYTALLRTSDNRKPTYVQALLIYLVQLAVVVACGLIAVYLLHLPIPGVTGALPGAVP